jgi:hypothetical protein
VLGKESESELQSPKVKSEPVESKEKSE